MSVTSSLSDNSRYEQACDQAIAMCDGNLRSTIKALIMATNIWKPNWRNCRRQSPPAVCRREPPMRRATLPDPSNPERTNGRCHLLRRNAIPAGR
jgi:hypothetical protein